MLRLTGIQGTSPIGYMAAIGLLRVLNQDLDQDVALDWDTGTPVLHGFTQSETLIDTLSGHMAQRCDAYEWTWTASSKKLPAADYAAHCKAAAHNPRALAFLAAFGTDTVLNDDGSIRTTRLDLTSGRQKLIADLRRLAANLSRPEDAASAFHTALFGGDYEDQPSFNWDPVSVRKHAYEHQAPSKTTPPGKRGVVWLAAESLALHPMLPDGNRARTIGCERIDDQGEHYFWGLWQGTALQIDEIRFLRALDFQRLKARPGISALWTSRFGKSGKYGILLPPRRIALT